MKPGVSHADAAEYITHPPKGQKKEGMTVLDFALRRSQSATCHNPAWSRAVRDWENPALRSCRLRPALLHCFFDRFIPVLFFKF
jgi:hypothetical protein